jgi:hypothetical protein
MSVSNSEHRSRIEAHIAHAAKRIRLAQGLAAERSLEGLELDLEQIEYELRRVLETSTKGGGRKPGLGHLGFGERTPSWRDGLNPEPVRQSG